MSDVPLISVVIPTLGRPALLARVLSHLDAQTGARGGFEVIVIADAQHDQPEALDALLTGRGYPAQRLQASTPGASAARNRGWRAAAAPLILFIDDDILPGPGLVQEHQLWHERNPDPEVGVLGRVSWARELHVTPFMRWLERGIQFDYPSIERNGPTWGHFYTANASVKRSLLERVDGFEEAHLPFGYEDLDLALRMHRAAGFRLVYNPAAEAEHVHPMDLDFWRRRVARIAVSERSFVARHPEIAPYFYDLFSAAAAEPPVTSRAGRLAAFVPRRLPVLGPLVWSHAEAYWRQALAGPFLRAWESTDHRSSESEVSISSEGSCPGGPK